MARLSSLVIVFALACGDDVDEADGGADTAVPDTGGFDSGSLVSPVAPAALPNFVGCPDGWRSVPHEALDGLVVCDPWPAAGPAECAAHEAHFLGDASCARVGSVCPADGWPTGLPSRDVVFVRSGAPPGGDGSRDTPFATMQEGATAVVDGGTVALAVGVYPGKVDVRRPMSLVGACAEGTVLAGFGGSGVPVIDIDDAGIVEVRDLTLRTDRANIILSRGTDVSYVSLVLDGSAITHSGGDATLNELVSRGYDDLSFGAIGISGAGDADLSRVVVVDSMSSAATVTPLGEVHIEDLSIRSAAINGLQVGGSRAVVRRVFVEDTADAGLFVDAPGEITDAVVRRVEGAMGAVGVFVTSNQSVRRVWIEDAADIGFTLAFEGGSVEDLVVVGSGASSGAALGRGIEIAGGVDASLTRVAVLNTAELGILVDGSATAVSFSDLHVEDVVPAGAGNFGRCLHGQQRAEIDVRRAVFRRCREAAVTTSYGASLVLRDARVEQTLPITCDLGCAEPRAGIGLVALEMGGRIDAERFVITESALAGVQVVEGGEIDLRDGTIEQNPVGVNVQVEGYDLSRVMERVVFSENGVNLDSMDLPVPAATASPRGP